MIELPEGFVLAKQLESALRGKKIASVKANSSPHKFAWFHGDPALYDALFAGRTVDGAFSYGGKLHIRLSGDAGFMFCDGVNLRYYTDAASLPVKHQLLLAFDDGTFLTGTVQMYGGIYGFEGALDNMYDRLAREKPDVLSDGFTLDYFLSLRDNALKPKHSAKAFLATEQRIPGLGNGVAQDILFHARISPKRDIATLTPDETARLYDAVRSTIAEMIEKGGRNVEKDLYGNPGGYETVMSANTYMFPCPRCSGTVKKEAYMGGSVYYCPACQK
jgi:formamidopyrimidine-DNA glycosylase